MSEHPNESFLELSHFHLYILNSGSKLEGLRPFFINNATPDFLFIRPSGNPIDAKGFEQMITDEIVQEKAEITKIHRFEFLSETIVMCIFTLCSKFTYNRNTL